MSGGGPKYESAHLDGKPAPEDLLLDTRKERIDSVIANRTRNFVVVLDRLVLVPSHSLDREGLLLWLEQHAPR